MQTSLEFAVESYVRFRGLKPATRNEYISTLRKWKRWGRGKPIEELTRGDGGDELLPAHAFKYAHDHGLDFLAITDHFQGMGSPRPLIITGDDYKSKLFDVAMAYNADHAGEFIAIPGIEWGTIKTGNHLNLLGAKTTPAQVHDTRYEELYAWAQANAEFVQFNHPMSWKRKSNRNKNVGNYGRARYSDTKDFVAGADPAVKTVSTITTVFGGHITGEHARSEAKTHREMQWENFYRRFLNQGFHLAPSANQDTHGPNWGTVTAARTAAWVPNVTYADLMTAFRKHRVYATEDDELAVALQVEHAGQRHWMGESVEIDDNGVSVDVIVNVNQGNGSDGDSADEGPYTVQIIRDTGGTGGPQAQISQTVRDVAAGTDHRINLSVTPGEYFYISVTEQGGKDNPFGEGKDITSADGTAIPDGKRDNLNDSAWTAPVWFVRAQAPLFVWSRRSSVYHDHDCFVVPRIGVSNRREGRDAPAGKRKHDCRQAP